MQAERLRKAMKYLDQTLTREVVRVLCKAQRWLSCPSEHFNKNSFKKKKRNWSYKN